MSHTHSTPGVVEKSKNSSINVIIKSEYPDSTQDTRANQHESSSLIDNKQVLGRNNGSQVTNFDQSLGSDEQVIQESVQNDTGLDDKNFVRVRKRTHKPSARLEQKRTKLKQLKPAEQPDQQVKESYRKQFARREQSNAVTIHNIETQEIDIKPSDIPPTDLLLSGPTQANLLPLSPPHPADGDNRDDNSPCEQAIVTRTTSDDSTLANMTAATTANDQAEISFAKHFQTKSSHPQATPVSPGGLQETDVGDYIDLDNQQKVNRRDVTSLDDSNHNTQLHTVLSKSAQSSDNVDHRVVVDQDFTNNTSNARRTNSQPVTGTFSKISDAQFECLSNLIKIIRSGNYNDFSELLERRSIKSNLMNVFVDGHTPLHYSIIYGRSLDWCRQLVLNGADPNLSNRAGWHPIHLAAFNGSRDTMRYLIDCYSDQ